jgi:nitroreductase/FMN reductase [NAD(P)H]
VSDGTDAAALWRARYGTEPDFAPPAGIVPGLAAILDRRVTRRYRPELVPEPLLRTLLAAAQSAPSKSDLQQYSIVVVQDPAKIALVADWIDTMAWIKEAPVFLFFCGDIRRGRRLCELRGLEHANDNADTFLNATADAALSMAHLILAAEMVGLGTCPVSYVRNHVERVAPLLGLPRGVFPVAGLTLGWPAARNAPSPRLPQSVVVHRERYDDGGLKRRCPATTRCALRPGRDTPRSTDLARRAAAGARTPRVSFPCRSASASGLGCGSAASRLTDRPAKGRDPTADNPGGAEGDGPGTNARPARPRDAASLILWRHGRDGPEVLMGLRHAKHRFMPNVLVFPGGRVDPGDHHAAASSDLRAFPRACLERSAAPGLAQALGIAAARELFEETGLALGRSDRNGSLLPDLGALDYLCRAVTPATMPIRFNARFLIAPAEAANGVVRGSGELEELRFSHWTKPRRTGSPPSPRRYWPSSAVGSPCRPPNARRANWSASGAWTTACRSCDEGLPEALEHQHAVPLVGILAALPHADVRQHGARRDVGFARHADDAREPRAVAEGERRRRRSRA